MAILNSESIEVGESPGGEPSETDTTHGAPATPDGLPSADAPAGELRSLDRRRISLDRTVGALGGGVILIVHLVAVPLVLLAGWPSALVLLAGAAWPLNLVLQVWLAVRWPVIDYRHWKYQVDAEGIRIWSGVIWRQVVAVPRSRVQHIDVSQGPMERSYGLATLSIYTAGTRYSKVDLPGLDHGVALALRDQLLPKDAEAAV